jgi:hypothetical protein
VARANGEVPVWSPARSPFGRADALALFVWTLAIVVFFWDTATLQKALFYFDITEINYPYRAFFANELKVGRFSRWCPGLYCGLPLYSESQVGYFHPLKYLLYPWMATWKAFNLDTILSVWLVGVGSYGWLRRHVGAIGALGGAATFGLSGFMWAHLIHTSMTNALVSVPFAVWALECAWESGRLRGIALGGIAVACQVFAGHLQDMLLTGMLLLLYGLYRAVTERCTAKRLFALGAPAGIVAIAVLVSAIQWIPSKDLLDRSPRAGGLSWDDITYGSWHPELLPTLIVREAYGTRARDTDWMDGFYPYHEMNAYVGVLGLGLAVLGAAAYRDRWVAFWLLVVGIGFSLMLGRFTFLFDFMHKVPILGSSRIPVRYHLWVSLAVAALAAVGLDRLAGDNPVRLRAAFGFVLALIAVAIPLALWIYEPAWAQSSRWTSPHQRLRYGWLAHELSFAVGRTLVVAVAGAALALSASRTTNASNRTRVTALLPIIMLVELLGSHWWDVPSVSPSYWTSPPAAVLAIRDDSTHQRIYGSGVLSAGEPGYASGATNEERFFQARDTLAWSLPIVWGLESGAGNTPIHPTRFNYFADDFLLGQGGFDIEGVTHVISEKPDRIGNWEKPIKAGSAYIHRNPTALPRLRFMGFPVYADNAVEAARALRRMGGRIRLQVLVEDPSRPVLEKSGADGTARIDSEIPERVEIDVDARTDGYLVLADAFDPGWTATVDGQSAVIRPAYVNFRAVYVKPGRHRVIFRYEPAGWRLGLLLSSIGIVATVLCRLLPCTVSHLDAEHERSGWPRWWPGLLSAVIVAVVAISVIDLIPLPATNRAKSQIPRPKPTAAAHSPFPRLSPRWNSSFHRFTWGADLDAMKPRTGSQW